MGLEEALNSQEQSIIDTIKLSKKYTAALAKWKKACSEGRVVDMVKISSIASSLIKELTEATLNTEEQWQFDLGSYLDGEMWIDEVREYASDRNSLRTLVVNGELLSSPITVHSAPARGCLLLGKTSWFKLRPTLVAAELKRLRDKTENAKSQDFMESLQLAWKYLSKNDEEVKFKEIYDLFCLTPGYKKEVSPAVFGQQIYALHKSSMRLTKSGNRCIIELPTGNVKDKDLFPVTSEDGKVLRYYTVRFA